MYYRMWSLGVVVAASLLAVVPNLFFCEEVSEGTHFSVTEDSTSNTVRFKCDIGHKFDFPNWTLDGDEVVKLNLTDAVVTNFDGVGITQFNISRSVVEGRTVSVEIDGEICSIHYCSNSTNSTCEPQGNTSQPTNFNCSMGATVCGPPSTAIVECTWKVPAGGSRPVNFTLRLPDGSEDSIPGNETSYSIVLICDGGGPQEVAITSDGNTDHVIYSLPTSACQSSCSTTGFFGQSLVAPLIVCVLIGLITIVVLSILIHAAQPTNFNCSLQLESEATVCGPPSTATVLCTWEVPAGRSVVFFTLNGTEVDVLVTNYSFVLSCEGEGPQLVAIAGSNHLNNMTYDLQNLIDKCQQGCSRNETSKYWWILAIGVLVVPLVVSLVWIVSTRPWCLKIRKLPESHDKHAYRISWSVLCKYSRQHLTISSNDPEQPLLVSEEAIQPGKYNHMYDVTCGAGFRYKAVVRAELCCCLHQNKIVERVQLWWPSRYCLTQSQSWKTEDEVEFYGPSTPINSSTLTAGISAGGPPIPSASSRPTSGSSPFKKGRVTRDGDTGSESGSESGSGFSEPVSEVDPESEPSSSELAHSEENPGQEPKGLRLRKARIQDTL